MATMMDAECEVLTGGAWETVELQHRYSDVYSNGEIIVDFCYDLVSDKGYKSQEEAEGFCQLQGGKNWLIIESCQEGEYPLFHVYTYDFCE